MPKSRQEPEGSTASASDEPVLAAAPSFAGTHRDQLYAEAWTNYTTVSTQVNELKLSEANDIRLELESVLALLHRYEKEKDEDALLKAVGRARLALLRANEIDTGLRGRISTTVSGTMGLAFLWGLIHLVAGWLQPPLAPFGGAAFYFDLFFVAFVGALTTWTLSMGGSVRERLSRLVEARNFSRLAASPFVAVALIALLSEITFGAGSAAGNPDVGTFTLANASPTLKLGFAFLFGFFGEASIDLLTRIARQTPLLQETTEGAEAASAKEIQKPE